MKWFEVACPESFEITGTKNTGIILCMRPANERRRCIATSYLIGLAHTQNNLWNNIIRWNIIEKNGWSLKYNLTRWDWDKMVTIWQTTFANYFFLFENYCLWVQITIGKRWLKPRVKTMTSRQAIIWNNDCLVYWRICWFHIEYSLSLHMS